MRFVRFSAVLRGFFVLKACFASPKGPDRPGSEPMEGAPELWRGAGEDTGRSDRIRGGDGGDRGHGADRRCCRGAELKRVPEAGTPEPYRTGSGCFGAAQGILDRNRGAEGRSPAEQCLDGKVEGVSRRWRGRAGVRMAMSRRRLRDDVPGAGAVAGVQTAGLWGNAPAAGRRSGFRGTGLLRLGCGVVFRGAGMVVGILGRRSGGGAEVRVRTCSLRP